MFYLKWDFRVEMGEGVEMNSLERIFVFLFKLLEKSMSEVVLNDLKTSRILRMVILSADICASWV